MDDQLWAGPTPLGPGRVLRFRRSGVIVWLPAALPFAAIVAAAVRSTNGNEAQVDVAGLPLACALLAVGAALAIFCIRRFAVTLTPAGPVFRTPLGTESLAWRDVTAINVEGPSLWITTPAGTFLAPLPATMRPADAGGQDAAPLGTQAWAWWDEAREPDWTPSPSVAWRPKVDVGGRVALRGNLAARLNRSITAVVFAAGMLVLPIGSVGVAAVLGLLIMALEVAYLVVLHLWTVVRIGPDGIIAQSWRGVERIRWSEVTGITETTDALPLGARRPSRLALVTPDGTVLLPAPVNSPFWYNHDPEYYRKWLWLHDLVDQHGGLSVPPAWSPGTLDPN